MNAFPKNRPVVLLAVAGISTLLGACAGAPVAAPVFDAQADARAQAASFIGSNGKTQFLSGVKKVAVTSCNLLFAETSAAHAGTGGGIFSEVGNVSRAEAKVAVLYTLNGMDDAAMQQMTNQVCSNAEQRLSAAGFEVVPRAQLLANDSFKALLASGKASPFNYKAPGKGSKTTYKVFAADGFTVYEPRYIGTAAGLGQALKAAKGDSAQHHEGLLMKTLDVSAVSINVLVDFAALQSDGQAKAFSFASKNTAEVQHKVDLGITGEIAFKPADQLQCWERFGKQECMLKVNTSPVFASKNAVKTDEVFYKDVVDTTTTGDKLAAGFTKALSVVAALGGVGGVSSSDVTRYSVNVEPAQFAAVSRKGIDGFLDMAFLSARQ